MTQQSNPTEFVFFWGPNEAHLPKACFNQWHRAVFEYNNFIFESAEQAMMAEKAALFKDWGTLQEILECKSPRAVKALGRQVANYVDGVWAEHRLDLVTKINYAKFSQNAGMALALIETGTATLVEASPVDTIWGIGMDDKHPTVTDPSTWRGTNLLGHALMAVRTQFFARMDKGESVLL